MQKEVESSLKTSFSKPKYSAYIALLSSFIGCLDLVELLNLSNLNSKGIGYDIANKVLKSQVLEFNNQLKLLITK